MVNIETDRLIIREMTMDDFDDLYEVLDDSDIKEHFPYTFNNDRVSNWINKNIERYSIFGFGLWAVVLKETGEMIGDCGVTMQNINNSIRPEIGYHLKKKYQRKGYSKEAARKCRDWVFENTTFNIIFSYMFKSNIASYSTAIANGMSKVDEFVDSEDKLTVVYAITREQWININN